MITFTFAEFGQPELSISLSVDRIFEVTHVRLTELAVAYHRQWVDAAGAIQIELQALNQGHPMTADEVAIALLLSDEEYLVPGLLEPYWVSASDSDLGIWLFFFLDELYRARGQYSSPWRMVEMLYDAFSYPDQLENFVPYMPPQDGRAVGVEFQLDAWREFLEAEKLRLSERK